MTKMTVKTNGHWREPVSFHDLPEYARSDFDYIEGEDRFSPRLFHYLGCWYDLCEFFRVRAAGPHDPHALRPKAGSPLAAWQGYQSDSYFSGVLVRYSDDFESIQVGRYCS